MTTNNFTDEQLFELQKYSKETLSYATKILTRDMAAAKSIPNQFAYFKGVCEKSHNHQSTYGSFTKQSKPKMNENSAAPAHKKAYERNDEEIRLMLKSTADCLRATAVEMGYDIEHRTLRDIELMMAGYQLTPITQNALGKSVEDMSKEDLDYLREATPCIAKHDLTQYSVSTEMSPIQPTVDKKEMFDPVTNPHMLQTKLFNNNPAPMFTVPFVDESGPWEEILN